MVQAHINIELLIWAKQRDSNKMIEHIVALLMFVGPDIKEHRIQIDPKTGKSSMSICLKHKREASKNS